MSIYDVGIGRPISWAEACALVDQALTDTATPLFAAVAEWSYPASMADLVQMAAAVGKDGERAMPWAAEAKGPSQAEIDRVHEELLEEITFSK